MTLKWQPPPERRVRWNGAHRLIPTRYPPVPLFERIADPADWEALIEIESLTNPRLRQQAGQISLVPVKRRVAGEGASIVMAPFVHISTHRPTRFSDGSYGVYYAAQQFTTALHEVAWHKQRFHHATSDPPMQSDYRCYKGRLDSQLHDISRDPQGREPQDGAWQALLSADPSSAYPKAQAFAQGLRAQGSNGLIYPSARHKGGLCLAAFWPDVVAIPVQTRHIALHWNGKRLDKWFGYEQEEWHGWPVNG